MLKCSQIFIIFHIALSSWQITDCCSYNRMLPCKKWTYTIQNGDSDKKNIGYTPMSLGWHTKIVKGHFLNEIILVYALEQPHVIKSFHSSHKWTSVDGSVNSCAQVRTLFEVNELRSHGNLIPLVINKLQVGIRKKNRAERNRAAIFPSNSILDFMLGNTHPNILAG